MERTNAGYTIIDAVRIDDTHEIVIGRHSSAPSPYVCWYCRNGDDYHTGRYCPSFKQALLVLADRIRSAADYLPPV